MLLAYVALVVPYRMGFGIYPQRGTAEYVVDLSVDYLFLIDVVLNFRTAYLDENDNEITDPRRVAWRYATSWLFVDLVSSLPIDSMSSNWKKTGSVTRLGKLLKLSKILKVFRLVKASSIVAAHADEIEVRRVLARSLARSLVATV